MIVWIVLGLLAVTVVLHLAAWLFHATLAARIFGPVPWLPAECCAPVNDGESVTFSTRDQVQLHGTYLPTRYPNCRGVIIFCHELNGDRWSGLPYTEQLRWRGFDVFTFDFRNHGASQRKAGYEPLPWATEQEVLDVLAAVDFVAPRAAEEGVGVGLLGVGRGAAAAIGAASVDDRIRASVLDSIVPAERLQLYAARNGLSRLVGGRAARLIPESLLGLIGDWAKLMLGWRHRCQILNVDTAAKGVHGSLLFVHGGMDSYVPVAAVRQLMGMAARRPRMWVVSHARHARAVASAGDAYWRRIGRFLTRHLNLRRITASHGVSRSEGGHRFPAPDRRLSPHHVPHSEAANGRAHRPTW